MSQSTPVSGVIKYKIFQINAQKKIFSQFVQNVEVRNILGETVKQKANTVLTVEGDTALWHLEEKNKRR